MKHQACEPCAKRKVRCDREEPCSNCKRRKQDHCTYVQVPPAERIRKLEAIVRSLGGDLGAEQQDAVVLTPGTSPATTLSHVTRQAQEPTVISSVRSQDPVVVEEDGQQVYLESHCWRSWRGEGNSNEYDRNTRMQALLPTSSHPHVFDSLRGTEHGTDLSQRYPNQQDAARLWSVFYQRVNPLNKITFQWSLEHYQSASMDPQKRQEFTNAEHAFMYSLYLVSLVSLSEDECLDMLQGARSCLLQVYQALCEEALARLSLFCMSEVIVIKAYIHYMIATVDRSSTRSLWSLMGLVIRNAERLGIHRDGALLGLSPAETEERRRVWWQLQHLDLLLAVRSGLTSMTLKADWDAEMPLNIEDEDISPNTTTFPPERQGLTGISYCLYIYWVLNLQRKRFNNDHARFELSWQTNDSIPYASKQSIITELEESLNRKFLQYCDPIKPVDSLLQINARFLICGFRLRILHPLACNTTNGEISEHHREALLCAAVQNLEYNVALHSQRSIRHFRWWTKNMFPWHAFMIVLVEISHHRTHNPNSPKTEQMWELLSDLYSSNSHLLQLSEDRRCSHAAELVVMAWNAGGGGSLDQSGSGSRVKPEFVGRLEEALEVLRGNVQVGDRVESERVGGEKGGVDENVNVNVNVVVGDAGQDEQSAGLLFDLDFGDVDWSFWNSID